MVKKILFLLIISSITVFSYAQKIKKTKGQAIKKHYFEMLINGENSPAEKYAPGEFIHFDFDVLDSKMYSYKYHWFDSYYQTPIETSPIKLVFPMNTQSADVNAYTVTLSFEILTKKRKKPIHQDIIAKINMDYKRTDIEVKVNPGDDITIPTTSHGDITFKNVRDEEYTPWDTVYLEKGGIYLVRWHVTPYTYIKKEYAITSCGAVVWGDVTVERPAGFTGNYITEIERLFPAENPEQYDTLKILTVTIIDKAQLNTRFDQEDFCFDDNMFSTILLETNFNAFHWKYFKDKNKEKATYFTTYETNLDVDNSGYYTVTGYMDTILYKTLPDLRIVNQSITKDIVVEDCELEFPNILKPSTTNFFGVKKLNPDRENELTITDRSGKTIFHQKNYNCVVKNNKYMNTDNAFSCIKDGKVLPNGAYFFELKYDAIPEVQTHSGAIVILKD
jgi:hypothetical protein